MADFVQQAQVSLIPAVTGFYILQELGIAAAQQESAIHKRAEAWHSTHEWTPRSVAERQEMWLHQGRINKDSRWAGEVQAVKKHYETQLARLFFDYLYVVACGEARHARSRIKHQIPEFPSDQSRTTVCARALDFDPMTTLPILTHLFRDFNWGGNYGGEPWAKICESAMLYKTMPDSVFIDHVVDLSHNGGFCFDKDVLISACYSAYDYQELLDKKFAGSLLEAKGLDIPCQIKEIFATGLKQGYVSCEARIKVRDLFCYTPQTFGEARISEIVEAKPNRYYRCGCQISLDLRRGDRDRHECENCGSCQGCCGCWECEGCGDLKASSAHKCSHCHTCKKCCECVLCNDCGDVLLSGELCVACELCNDCCECRICEKCIKPFSEEDIQACGQCKGCCECIKCETCDNHTDAVIEGDCIVCWKEHHKEVGQLNLIKRDAA